MERGDRGTVVYLWHQFYAFYNDQEASLTILNDLDMVEEAIQYSYPEIVEKLLFTAVCGMNSYGRHVISEFRDDKFDKFMKQAVGRNDLEVIQTIVNEFPAEALEWGIDNNVSEVTQLALLNANVGNN